MPQRIELEPGGAEDPGTSLRLTTGKCPNAQDEFGKVKGLREIVISAKAETVDPVPGGASRSQHEHHRTVVAVDDHPAERVAMNARQVPVEHDDVLGVAGKRGCRVGSVVGDVDGHTLVAQSFGHDVGEMPRVLDDKYSHAGSPGRASTRNAASTSTVRDGNRCSVDLEHGRARAAGSSRANERRSSGRS